MASSFCPYLIEIYIIWSFIFIFFYICPQPDQNKLIEKENEKIFKKKHIF